MGAVERFDSLDESHSAGNNDWTPMDGEVPRTCGYATQHPERLHERSHTANRMRHGHARQGYELDASNRC